MYSHGSPYESILNSRPACGISVGLCNDVNDVSRQRRCGGVPIIRCERDLPGLDDDNKFSSSGISSCSRTSDASADDVWPDARRCGLVGPRVVTTFQFLFIFSSKYCFFFLFNNYSYFYPLKLQKPFLSKIFNLISFFL